MGKRQLGDIDFGPQAELDLPAQIIRWFDYGLKELDNGVAEESAVRYFCMGESGGWRSAATWPPEDLTQKIYHLHSAGDAQRVDGGGYLHERAPAGKESADRYVYDPRDPVPTL